MKLSRLEVFQRKQKQLEELERFFEERVKELEKLVEIGFIKQSTAYFTLKTLALNKKILSDIRETINIESKIHGVTAWTYGVAA